MPFWDYPDAEERTPLNEIVVRAEHIEGDEPRYVTMDVQDFVLSMLQTAHYPLRAVPREAVLSAAVDYYICTVENGGHSGFIGNSGWDEALRGNIREGLDRLGLEELAHLFGDLESFARNDPSRFETSDWTEPTLSQLDDRFAALPIDEYFARHAAWIRSWPNLWAVPGERHREVIAELAARNRKRRWWQ